MNGIKEDVIFSTNKPVICNSCIEKLKTSKVPHNIILKSQNEIKKIKKTCIIESWILLNNIQFYLYSVPLFLQ